MPNLVIEELVTEVAEEVTIMGSAKVLIDGFEQRLADGIAKALENGATAEQLVPLTQLKTALDVSGNDLAASVAKNTPADPNA